MIGSAIAVLTALVAAVGASGEPLVSFKAKATPIAGFAGTGNFFGAGEAIEAEYTISGNEYGGFPPPLIGVNLYLPAGVTLHSSGFPVCPPFELEPSGKGPKACARDKAGPTGAVQGWVAFGKGVAPETSTIEPFYAPGGGLEFFTFGHEPVLLEILSKGHFVDSSGLYSKKLEAVVPLAETLPGANDVSFRSIKYQFGSAIQKGGETVYFARAPLACPKRYLPYKAELTFAGLAGLSEQTVTAEYKAPCPRRGEEEPEPQPLPGTEGVVTAPSNKTCVSKRDFRIHIVHIPHLVYQLVTVEVNGKPVKVLRGKRQSAQIDLRGVPKGTYVARIGVVTTSGRLITGTRTYHTCAAHAIHPKRPPRL